jgi:hypothetical protein
MACTVNISEEAQKKYNLPKEMGEAEFNAWLANGGLQLLSNDKKISIDGYKIVENKFIESLGVGKKLREYIKKTVKQLNKMIYTAEEEGSKTGAKEEKSKIDSLQEEARDFLRTNKISSSESIEKAIGKIRNEKTFARFLLTVQSQQDAEVYFDKVEKVKGLLKEIGKLKSKDKLTASNKKFIKDISFPSPMEVSDLDTYAALLQEFLDRRGKGASTFGNIDDKLKDFIDEESSYIAEYKRNINAINEMLADLALEEEYESLIKEGVFEDTDINSFEDYKAFVQKLEEQSAILDADAALLDKISKTDKAKEVAKNIKIMLEQNAEEFKEDFDLASTESMVLDFSLLQNADLSMFSLNELILLSNVLDGILYDGNFMGYDKFRSKLSQAERKEGLYKVLKDVSGKIRKLLNITEKSLRSVPATITSQAFGVVSEAALTSFVFGKWNSMISKIERYHNNTMTGFEKKMRALGSKALESSVAVETFAFINQYDEGLTAEEQQEQFKNDTTVYARSAANLYEQMMAAQNLNQRTKVNIEKAKNALKALERFGVIKDLVFGKESVTYELVEDVTRESIQDKLDAKEQDLYDYLIGEFAKTRPDFANGMEIGLGLPFRGIVNYFPRFSAMDISKDVTQEDEATIQSILSDYSGVSRTQDRAKKRSVATGNYSIGLRENFSKGFWQNLLVAYGQQEINDIINSIYSDKVGIQSLVKDKVLSDAKVMQNALISQVKRELTYGNVSLNDENLILNQLASSISSMYYGFVLNHPFQLPKQVIPALFANFILSPKTSRLTYKILSNKELSDKIIDNSTIVKRVFKSLALPNIKSYPAEYLMGGTRSTVSGLRTIGEKFKLGDIIKPAINKVRRVLGKEVTTEELLDFGDYRVSRFNIIAGYIDYLKKTNKGITDEQILEKIENEGIDENALNAGETWQQQLNSISSSAQQGKKLSNTGLAQMLYMFKSFQVNTHQEFLKNARRLAFNRSSLTNEETYENVKSMAAYIAQQAAFRATASVLTQLTLSAIAKSLDDDDEEQVYLYEKSLTQFLVGLGTDIFLGSAGVIGDIAVGIAANLYWENQKEKYTEEIRKTDPSFDPKGTPLDPNKPLSIEPQIGGSMFATYELFKRETEEWKKESEALKEAGLPSADAAMYPIVKTIAFVTASGTLRDAGSALNNIQNPKVDRINAFIGALEPEFGYQYEFKNKEDLIKLSESNIKPKDVAKLSLFLKEDEDKGYLYVMPKSVMAKAKDEANKELYGKVNPTQEEVLNSQALKDIILNRNVTEEVKKQMAREQFRKIYNAFLKTHIEDKGVVKYPIVAKK